MDAMSVTWEQIVARATRLPQVEESTSYRTPSLKVAGQLMARLRSESEGALAVRCDLSDKEALVSGDDPAFFTIPHYDGHGYVLVDLALVDADELFELITDAWRLVAPAKVTKELPS